MHERLARDGTAPTTSGPVDAPPHVATLALSVPPRAEPAPMMSIVRKAAPPRGLTAAPRAEVVRTERDATLALAMREAVQSAKRPELAPSPY